MTVEVPGQVLDASVADALVGARHHGHAKRHDGQIANEPLLLVLDRRTRT